MTDYNDGNWHGWNGGECPVHPGSHIQAMEFSGGNTPVSWECSAGLTSWGSFRGAFRVVMAYREPRRCWTYADHKRDTEAEAIAFRKFVTDMFPSKRHEDGPITEWVEVLK